jgi:hypothetical protein
MNQETIIAAVVAGVTYLLFTGGGTWLQLRKIVLRKRAIADGAIAGETATQAMSALRYYIFYLCFYFISLVGLTREHIDHMLLWTRFPIIIMSAFIIYYIHQDQKSQTVRFYYWSTVVLLVVYMVALIASPIFGRPLFIATTVDAIAGSIAIPLAIGHYSQCRRVLIERKVGGVSIARDLATASKDVFGLIYCLIVGSTLWSVALLHIISLIGNGSVLLVCLWVKQDNGSVAK